MRPHYKSQGTVPSTRHPRAPHVSKRPYDGVRAAIARVIAEASTVPVRICKKCGLEISGDNARSYGRYARCKACDNARKAEHYRATTARKSAP